MWTRLRSWLVGVVRRERVERASLRIRQTTLAKRAWLPAGRPEYVGVLSSRAPQMIARAGHARFARSARHHLA